MRRASGFTLVEVLVALVVTVVALTVLAQGFTDGARTCVVAQNTTRAALLAQQILVDFETEELPFNTGHSGDFEEAPGFSYETSSDTMEVGLTQVTIVIRWDDRGREREYKLVRLMRDRPEVEAEVSTEEEP